MRAMPIPSTGQLITDCWMRAEHELRDAIQKEFHDCNEEMITDLFRGKLRTQFVNASESGAVEGAFFDDLKDAFSNYDSSELRAKISRGLIATVTFHPHETEGKTGGDLGIVVVRPDVQEATFGWPELAIEHEYKRGLLSQAKIFGRDSRWGGLSAAQERNLPNKLGYFALVPYRYSDQTGERRELMPFSWQSANAGATVELLSLWLSSDQFPNLQNSQQILGALVRDEIGTDDKEAIHRDIAPPLRRSLEIRIGWKDDGPEERVQLQQLSMATDQQRLVQYQ